MNATGFVSGIDQKKVSLIESDARQVTDAELLALSHALNVSIHWLLGNHDHRPVLQSGDSVEARKSNAIYLLQELVVENRRVMQRWAEATGQSAQLDSGYLTQHLISAVTGIRGDDRRGKGLDFIDGSEAKSASDIDNVDRGRWNHNFGETKKATRSERVAEWLDKPCIFYAYWQSFSQETGRARDGSHLIRVRVWAVKPQTDQVYRTLLETWRDVPGMGYNFQLHPVRSPGSNIAANNCGNIELPLLFKASENDLGQVEVDTMNHLDQLGPCRAVSRG